MFKSTSGKVTLVIAIVAAHVVATTVLVPSKAGLDPERENYPLLIGCLMAMDSYDFSDTCRAIDMAPNRDKAVMAACVASLGSGHSAFPSGYNLEKDTSAEHYRSGHSAFPSGYNPAYAPTPSRSGSGHSAFPSGYNPRGDSMKSFESSGHSAFPSGYNLCLCFTAPSK